MDEEQLNLLAMSYGIERILEDHDIEQTYVLRLLIEEGLVELEEYFDLD